MMSRFGNKGRMVAHLDRDSPFGLHCNSFSFFATMPDVLMNGNSAMENH
jgi:hypothetical protein